MQIKFKKLNPLAKEPFQTHKTDACFDVYATSIEDMGDGRIKYGIGLAFELPENTRMDFDPRSSIHKTGLLLSNSVGIIDQEYRGEVCAVFYNVLSELPNYEIGDRIGQIHIESVNKVNFMEVMELSDTERGAGGFGSTGLK